jgi:hypothetical protein
MHKNETLPLSGWECTLWVVLIRICKWMHKICSAYYKWFECIQDEAKTDFVFLVNILLVILGWREMKQIMAPMNLNRSCQVKGGSHLLYLAVWIISQFHSATACINTGCLYEC